jgi:hypothetical protein
MEEKEYPAGAWIGRHEWHANRRYQTDFSPARIFEETKGSKLV